MFGAKEAIEGVAEEAGITIDGSPPHDLRVHDDRFYRRVLRNGSLGLGESYVDGWWDTDAADETIRRVLQAGIRERASGGVRAVLLSLLSRLVYLQGRRRAGQNARDYYERGLDLFRAMLDERMVYSCGYWRNAQTLEEAQEAKLELVCRKVGLREARTLLDIGCGCDSPLAARGAPRNLASPASRHPPPLDTRS